jgi:diguanylate cyclase (GGDEF)-like protein
MQKMENWDMKQKNMLIPVLLCLAFTISCFSFLIYMMEKNEQEKITYFYNAAKQNQSTIKSRLEEELKILSGLSVSFGLGGIHNKDGINSIIDKINEGNPSMKIGFLDNDSQNVEDSVQGCYKVAVRDDTNHAIGMIYVKNSGEILSNIVSTMAMAGEGLLVILDKQGKEVAGSNRAFYSIIEATKTRTQIEQAIKVNEQVSFNIKAQDKKRQTVVVMPLGINDWYLLNVFPQPNFYVRYLEMTIGVGVMILFSCGLFLSFFYRQFLIINKNQKTLVKLAYGDSVTGTRNYSSFKHEMEKKLRKEKSETYAVWYCDIKKFKFMNDILGYEEGDKVLISLANLFRDYGGPDTLYCRVSADNFAGLYKYKTREEMEEWFQKLVTLFQERYLPYNKKIPMELSMGAYCIEETDVEELSIDQIVDKANIAQKNVKGLPGNPFGFYNKEIRNRVLFESELESEIDRALRNQEFKIFVQPKVSIQKENRIVGGEALVRWENPRKGTIPPGQFIPIMERAGKIVLLDRYMFEKSCQWLHDYLAAGRPPVNIAVNVSKIGMLREDFVDFYGEIKNKYEIPDGLLELEFTETVLLSDDAMFNRLVKRLNEKGFVCSLDDFGSGYSSLNLLKNLKIDVLKLDIMFFRKSSDISRERIVISNIINMAKELKIKTIAEGVEYVETVEFLRSAGCDVIQGYVFYKAMPIKEFEQMISEKKNESLMPVDTGE